jgi:hypothetical protein
VPLPNRATATIGDIATWKWLGDALWASDDHGEQLAFIEKLWIASLPWQRHIVGSALL